jgi:hypothetical protein
MGFKYGDPYPATGAGMTGQVSDATSRLMTWIAAETPKGFPTNFTPKDRSALAADVLTLIDALDLNKMPRDPRLEYAPYTNEIYVYLAWALIDGKCTLIAVATDQQNVDQAKRSVPDKTAVFSCERVRLNELIGCTGLQQQGGTNADG